MIVALDRHNSCTSVVRGPGMIEIETMQLRASQSQGGPGLC
jgi:hypothetical protein